MLSLKNLETNGPFFVGSVIFLGRSLRFSFSLRYGWRYGGPQSINSKEAKKDRNSWGFVGKCISGLLKKHGREKFGYFLGLFSLNFLSGGINLVLSY